MAVRTVRAGSQGIGKPIAEGVTVKVRDTLIYGLRGRRDRQKGT